MLCLLLLQSAHAQELTKSFLRKLDYYKYANVSIFEADGSATTRFREVITPGLPRTPALEQAEQECTNTDDIKKRIQKKQPVPQTLIDEGGSPTECEVVKNYYTQLASLVQIGKVYVICERYTEGSDPVILGVVGIQAAATPQQAADPDFLKNSLNGPISSAVLDASDLKQFKTKEYEKDEAGTAVAIRGSIESTSFDNMYDYLKNMIKQNPAEKTASVRPAQSVAMKINKEVVTKMIAEDRVDEYLMITEGEPHKVIDVGKDFSDEIVIGFADLISWRHYQDPASMQGDPTKLPQYGVEMRFGHDDIGYPSLWSERVCLNALWDANKLGLILPTSLWAPQILPILTLPSRFTTLQNSVGLTGNFDFPFKLIERSGVFNVAGSVMLGNSVAYNDRGPFANEFETGIPDSLRIRKSFLMRWHGLINYTFSIGINDPDKDNLGYNLRFKIGVAGYQMEQWIPRSLGAEFVPGTDRTTSLKFSPFFRIEYMSYGLSVPFGAYIQYFDGAGSGMAWLQVPISDTGFLTAIRIDGRIFLPIVRGPYEWESSLVAVPSLRFIFRW
ncbi:MAG: hypothetical protein RML40_10130 [Bacteroidota bacterium]|nr:hypothetical protein [Candidatus Kapabacteria bacterium]MDW8220877.1 hypothetical protein [Bacteroidota bacterium]